MDREIDYARAEALAEALGGTFIYSEDDRGYKYGEKIVLPGSVVAVLITREKSYTKSGGTIKFHPVLIDKYRFDNEARDFFYAYDAVKNSSVSITHDRPYTSAAKRIRAMLAEVAPVVPNLLARLEQEKARVEAYKAVCSEVSRLVGCKYEDRAKHYGSGYVVEVQRTGDINLHVRLTVEEFKAVKGFILDKIAERIDREGT